MFLRPKKRRRLHHHFGTRLGGGFTPLRVALRAFDDLLRRVPVIADAGVPTPDGTLPRLGADTDRIRDLKFDELVLEKTRPLFAQTLDRFSECARAWFARRARCRFDIAGRLERAVLRVVFPSRTLPFHTRGRIF